MTNNLRSNSVSFFLIFIIDKTLNCWIKIGKSGQLCDLWSVNPNCPVKVRGSSHFAQRCIMLSFRNKQLVEGKMTGRSSQCFTQRELEQRCSDLPGIPQRFAWKRNSVLHLSVLLSTGPSLQSYSWHIKRKVTTKRYRRYRFSQALWKGKYKFSFINYYVNINKGNPNTLFQFLFSIILEWNLHGISIFSINT